MPSIVLIPYIFLFRLSAFRGFSLGCLLILFLVSCNVSADDNLQAKEYLVKSAFLYNFARLSEWPEDTFKSASDPFKICIMGNDSFGVALNSIRHKKINGHPLLIIRRATLKKAAECQMVFISRSEEKQLSAILSYLKSFPVMTVSELPGFAQKGGHIRLFLTDENTLSLEINLQAIRAAHLRISSRILTLASIIESSDTGEGALE